MTAETLAYAALRVAEIASALGNAILAAEMVELAANTLRKAQLN